MALRAGYPNTTGFRKVVKACILIKKKEGMSDADFIEHYTQRHARMAADAIEKHSPITYSLSFCLDRDRKMMSDMLRGNAQMSEYHAICTFVFKDYKGLAKFMYDPAGKELAPDHENFMIESEMRMIVGDEYMVIEEGKRVA